MHPIIRIISFIIFAGFVAFGDVRQLLAAFLVLFIVMASNRFRSLDLSLRFLKRMRWFFLSILVIYLWFTPGRPLLGEGAAYIPTIEGLQTGVLRVCSLILIVLAVNYFVSMIARNPLVEAIVWLLTPLNLLGIDHRVLALRMVLTLEFIPKVQGIVLDVADREKSPAGSAEPAASGSTLGNRLVTRLGAISNSIEQVFEKVLDCATAMEPKTVELTALQKPPAHQWIYPVLLYGLFLCTTFIGVW